MLRIIAALAAVVAIASPLVADINIPPEVEVGRKIVATLSIEDMPEGAEIKGQAVFDAPGCDVEPGKYPGTFHVWAPARDAKYEIMAFGMWGLKHPTVPGAWVDFGFYRYTAAFRVTGEVAPDPGPDPPNPPDPGPNPGDKYNLVYFVQADELDKLPVGQSLQVNSLSFRNLLAQKGHKLVRVIDDDQISGLHDSWAPWVAAADGAGFPCLVIQNQRSGEMKAFPMPASINDALAIVGEGK